MKFLACSMILFALSISATSQVRVQTKKQKPVYQADRDLVLEKQAYTRSASIEKYLSAEAKKELESVIRQLIELLAKDIPDFDIEQFVEKAVRRNFRNISAEQSNLAKLYVLAKTAEMIASQDSDSMGDLSDAESLRLQVMMEEASALMYTLSQVMKKASSTQDSLVQNMK